MPRNRVIYQTEALFNTADTVDVTSSTQTIGSAIQQFNRVQSCNYNFNISRKDVNQYGNLAAIDRIILDQPTIGLDFSYLICDFWNEKNLGFTVSQSQGNLANVTSAVATTTALSGILTSGFVNTKNYYIRTVAEGNDANSYSVDLLPNTVGNTIGIGNAFISNYSVNAAVGDFPKASVSLEALNMNFSAGNSGIQPGVTSSGTIPGGIFQLPTGLANPNPENPSGTQATVSALRHGDISFLLTQTAGTNFAGTNITSHLSGAIQSFDIGLALKRQPLQKIGSRYAFSREIDFPVSLDLTVKALVQDLTTGNLVDLVNNDATYDATIKLAAPNTTGFEGVAYILKRVQIDSQDFSSAIGSNKEVTLKFSTQIGSPQQTDRGLFLFDTLPVTLP
jgi:hypothetical protein